MQLVALSFYRFESAALLRRYRQSALASCLMVCVTLGFEARERRAQADLGHGGAI